MKSLDIDRTDRTISMDGSDGDTRDYQSVVSAKQYTPNTSEISATDMSIPAIIPPGNGNGNEENKDKDKDKDLEKVMDKEDSHETIELDDAQSHKSTW